MLLKKTIIIFTAIIAAVTVALTPVWGLGQWLGGLYGILGEIMGGAAGIGIDIVFLQITINIYNNKNN